MDVTDSGMRHDAVTDAASPPVPRSRFAVLRRPVPQGLLALAIYLTVFIVGFGLPIASHLDVPQLRQYWTDPNFYIWAMRWWPYAVSHGINPLYSNQIGAPDGYNLAWATTTPSAGLLMWPVTAAVGVVTSFNLTLLAVPPVSAWAAFVAARRLTGRFWASLLAGAVYGLTPFELVHDWQGQPNLTVIALFPLMVYLMVRWWDGSLGRTGFVCWLTVAMAVEFYTFNEAFADMTVVGAGGLLLGFAVAGREARRKVARLARLTGIAYAGAVVLASPYLVYALRHYPSELTRQRDAFSLHLVRLILPVSDKLFGLTSLIKYSNHMGRADIDDYVGIPLLLIPLALVALARSNRIARLLACALVFVLALAVGPVLVVGNRDLVHLPWGALWSLPIARSAEPSRLIIFVYLLVSIALALWLAGPANEPAGAAENRAGNRPGHWSGKQAAGQPAGARGALGPRAAGGRGPPGGPAQRLRRGEPGPVRLPAAGHDAAGQPVARLHHPGHVPEVPEAGRDRRDRHVPRQRRAAVPGRRGLLLPHRRRLHQRLADPPARRPPVPGRQPQPGDPASYRAVQGLRPRGGDRRRHRRAGLGPAVDADRLPPSRPARHVGRRRDHLPHRLTG